jgi:hypothetical protein
MSGSGEIIPELAELLRDIADRIDANAADQDDSTTLRRLALQAAGEDRGFSLKVHRRRRGGVPLGAAGVDRRLAMARAVKKYRDEHEGCTLDDAYRALAGELEGPLRRGAQSLKNAWQEMGPLLSMSEQARQAALFFLKLKARGFDIKMTRTKRTTE